MKKIAFFFCLYASSAFADLTFDALVGKWTSPTGTIIVGNTENVAHQVRFIFERTDNHFLFDYAICQTESQCSAGRDSFYKVKGRIEGNTLYAQCKEEFNGEWTEKKMGSLNVDLLYLSLPDHRGYCTSSSYPYLYITKLEDKLDIQGKELFNRTGIDAKATVVKQ